MILEILSKLTSESLLSLYPVFVKNIGLSLPLQTWSRCFSYAAISLFFIDPSFVLNTLFTWNGILLAIITIVHIYTSYRGFLLLESGVAYSIFYLYPIMILLMGGQKINAVMLLALLGVFLLANKDWRFDHIMKESNGISYEGLGMILLAAYTEAVIYFLVRDIKTTNNWNHIFLSYFLGAAALTWYMKPDISKIKWNGRISMSLGINSFIGLIGYLLRFYAVSRLETAVYAPLSYFGIVMSFVYGVFINGERVNWIKILGAAMIILSNFLLL